VFEHILKHLEVRQKYSATRRIFNALLSVSKCDQTRSFGFDTFLKVQNPYLNDCFHINETVIVCLQSKVKLRILYSPDNINF